MSGDFYTFNEFQRELTNRHIDPQVAYMMTAMYERMTESAEQIDQMATLLSLFSDQLARFAQLRAMDVQDIEKIKAKAGVIGKTPGIDVQSVAIDPNERD